MWGKGRVVWGRAVGLHWEAGSRLERGGSKKSLTRSHTHLDAMQRFGWEGCGKGTKAKRLKGRILPSNGITSTLS